MYEEPLMRIYARAVREGNKPFVNGKIGKAIKAYIGDYKSDSLEISVYRWSQENGIAYANAKQMVSRYGFGRMKGRCKMLSAKEVSFLNSRRR